MTQKVEDKLLKIPVLNWIVKFLKKVKLPGMVGMSLYDVIEMYVTGIVKGALTSRAGSISFSFFMAIFPFLLFMLNLLPFLPIDSNEFMAVINNLVPPKTADFVDTIVEDIISHQREGLLLSTLGLAMFLMANGVNSIFSGFEYSYHIKQTRNIFSMYLYSFGVGLLLAFLMLFTITTLVYVEVYVVQYLSELASKTAGINVESGDVFGIQIAQYIFFILMIYIGTAILYFFGTKEGRKAKFFSAGAMLTTILVMLTTYLFGIYVKNFAQYNELYGSIGTLLILMLYIWLNSIILLLGFELNASLNRLKSIHFLEETSKKTEVIEN
ncbi:YihY/virulence factor BrkB family protein [Lutibacter sp. TH_r2]|uniref:YihY/virulence factor BrkB family protein n=1 Tax=Lutibacter sp. TH_r2 TaxID=3082083 RepID=UPI002953206A|nr:YihY/virulence factor BrkB family protein [Lutibacter sp. TH_r2]MDV7188097.1 YihY/virulence factor BrkB family protein [Lutibacter sp. TH_r2]